MRGKRLWRDEGIPPYERQTTDTIVRFDLSVGKADTSPIRGGFKSCLRGKQLWRDEGIPPYER